MSWGCPRHPGVPDADAQCFSACRSLSRDSCCHLVHCLGFTVLEARAPVMPPIRFLLAVLVLQVAGCAGQLDQETVDQDGGSSGLVISNSSPTSVGSSPPFLQRLTRI